MKGAIILVDAHPFKIWYEKYYGKKIGLKGKKDDSEAAAGSERVLRKLKSRQKNLITLDQSIDDQFASGRLLAKVTSRPGQSGRCDGYVLEGKELDFYKKQMAKK